MGSLTSVYLLPTPSLLCICHECPNAVSAFWSKPIPRKEFRTNSYRHCQKGFPGEIHILFLMLGGLLLLLNFMPQEKDKEGIVEVKLCLESRVADNKVVGRR
jgi:hypothetical protein